MKRGALRLVFGVTIALAPSVAPAAASLLVPDGLADPSGKSGFVAVESGVAAIDLESGKVAWRSIEAAIPLVAWDGKLAAMEKPTWIWPDESCAGIMPPGIWEA